MSLDYHQTISNLFLIAIADLISSLIQVIFESVVMQSEPTPITSVLWFLCKIFSIQLSIMFQRIILHNLPFEHEQITPSSDLIIWSIFLSAQFLQILWIVYLSIQVTMPSYLWLSISSFTCLASFFLHLEIDPFRHIFVLSQNVCIYL